MVLLTELVKFFMSFRKLNLLSKQTVRDFHIEAKHL